MCEKTRHCHPRKPGLRLALHNMNTTYVGDGISQVMLLRCDPLKILHWNHRSHENCLQYSCVCRKGALFSPQRVVVFCQECTWSMLVYWLVLCSCKYRRCLSPTQANQKRFWTFCLRTKRNWLNSCQNSTKVATKSSLRKKSRTLSSKLRNYHEHDVSVEYRSTPTRHKSHYSDECWTILNFGISKRGDCPISRNTARGICHTKHKQNNSY